MADGGKNKKYGSNVDSCKIYQATDRWNKNRKRAMRRHIRANPGDFHAHTLYEKRYGGKVKDLGVSSKGRRLLERR